MQNTRQYVIHRSLRADPLYYNYYQNSNEITKSCLLFTLLPLHASDEQYGTNTILAENKKGFSSGFHDNIPVPETEV